MDINGRPDFQFAKRITLSGFLPEWHTGLAGFLVCVHFLVCLFEQGMVIRPVRCQTAAERENEGDVQAIAQTGAAVVLQFRQALTASESAALVWYW